MVSMSLSNKMPEQVFLVNITVIEGRHFAIPSMDSVVHIRIGNQKKTTNVKLNTDNPYYNEYFVFELNTTEDKLIDTFVTFTVMQPRKAWRGRKVLGTFRMDVASIWAQPDHQFYHKWAVLASPYKDSAPGPKGYLKLDIYVLTMGETPKYPATLNNNDEIEGNLLMLDNSLNERQWAQFTFNIFHACDLPKTKGIMKKTFHIDSESQPTTFVQVSFGGLSGKTTMRKQTQNPVWNEQIILNDLFPPLCQGIKIELKFQGHTNVTNFLNFKSISNSGEKGFLPAFGPNFIYFYTGENKTEYSGKLFVSIQTEILDKITGTKQLKNTLRIPQEDELWKSESTYLFASIFSANMINKKYKNKKVSFELSMGNVTKRTYSVKCLCDNKEIYCYLQFDDKKPSVALISTNPDQRRRLFNSNMISKIHNSLESKLDTIEQEIEVNDLLADKTKFEKSIEEVIKDLELNCKKYLDVTNSIKTFGDELDHKRFKLCTDEIKFVMKRTTILNRLKNKRKVFKKLKATLIILRELIEDPQKCWPDILLWMYSNEKKVAYYKISPQDLIYSKNPTECGNLCGVVRDVYLQPLQINKHKNIGSKNLIECKIELFLWIGLENEKEICSNMFPLGYQLSEKEITNSTQLTSKEQHLFECRIYVFQSRYYAGHDDTSLADPFLRIITDQYIYETKPKFETLNPIWDETIIFPQIILYGSFDFIKNQAPLIIIESYDKDKHGNDFLGRSELKPKLKMKNGADEDVKLHWRKVLNEEVTGEILVDAQLIEYGVYVDEDKPINIPDSIRPVIAKYRLEVMFWGVRDLKKINLCQINKPKITIECGGHTIESTTLTNARKNLNFVQPYKAADIELPLEKEYLPPLTIKMYDARGFGRYLYVGTHQTDVSQFIYKTINKDDRENLLKKQKTNSETYYSCTSSKSNDTGSELEKLKLEVQDMNKNIFNWVSSKFRQRKRNKINKIKTLIEQSLIDHKTLDWWTKFYSSLDSTSENDYDNKYKLKIYRNELELQPQFKGFNDQLKSFDMYHGKLTGDELLDDDKVTGQFKGAFRIYRLTPPHVFSDELTECGAPIADGAFSIFPSNEPMSFVVRIYVIRALNLMPRDVLNGKSDPYIQIVMGSKFIDDSKHFISNQTNPVFGRCFQLNGVLPEDHSLIISIWDYDVTSSNDLIGETKIDLEKRLFTKHRAKCGISNIYQETGPCFWRDQRKPSEILETLCKIYNVTGPIYTNNTVQIGYTTFQYTDTANIENLHENVSLEALKHWHELPVVGYQLVPEHVETRSLYHPHKPAVEQGKLQLWIDLFPYNDLPPPAPVDIAPRAPQQYELRAVVWNTEDVILVEDYFFTGEKKSDIYVKGWLTDPTLYQCTDVHYNSFNGEGYFNWRFIFPFHYLSIENKIVVYSKDSVFSSRLNERKIPCNLILQIWDNDTFSADDFIGSLSLELSRLPRGAKVARRCNKDIYDVTAPKINLFKTRRHRGWWPLFGKVKDKTVMTGKVEVELELLTVEEANLCPAGFGRQEPQKLPEPKRPDTSISIFQNPLKHVKFVWRKYRWKLAKYLLIILLILLVLIGLYAFPGYFVKKLIRA